ncbi:uncharacterized protein BO96DRAFT_347250, partial [Aspergillus niger CBS 101883]
KYYLGFEPKYNHKAFPSKMQLQLNDGWSGEPVVSSRLPSSHGISRTKLDNVLGERTNNAKGEGGTGGKQSPEQSFAVPG